MALAISLAPFRTRDDFGTFLNEAGLTGLGVEIGTHRGDFADQLLSQWKGTLYCVDPWSVPEGYEDQAKILAEVWATDGNRQHDRDFCEYRLKKYGSRVTLVEKVSVEGAKLFKENTLDFVYIDGDHRREMVYKDLETWLPLIKPSGILAGHDFLNIGEPEGGCSVGIQSALLPFAREHKLTIHMVTAEGTLPWSYYLQKPR
jgi:predicted O-methyltransferase YrrM